MTIDTAMIKHLATLSVLELDEKEVEEIKGDLESILKFVGEVESCEIDEKYKEDRLVHISELREDELKTELSQEDVLINAPKQKNGYFVVPQVVE